MKKIICLPAAFLLSTSVALGGAVHCHLYLSGGSSHVVARAYWSNDANAIATSYSSDTDFDYHNSEIDLNYTNTFPVSKFDFGRDSASHANKNAGYSNTKYQQIDFYNSTSSQTPFATITATYHVHAKEGNTGGERDCTVSYTSTGTISPVSGSKEGKGSDGNLYVSLLTNN